MAEARVFDERTLRRLEQVMLWSQRARAGAMKGERRSIRRGTSIEFADYRDYAYGDDLRRLDWNVYARLQRPYIKLLEDEEDLALHILIDASVSMDWPAGEADAERNKFRHAQRLAAGLAWCALASNDRTQLHGVNGAGSATFGPHRGRGHNLRLLDFIADLQAAGEVDLDAVLREQALRGARPGLFVLISDMYTPVNLTDALNELAAAGHELLAAASAFAGGTGTAPGRRPAPDRCRRRRRARSEHRRESARALRAAPRRLAHAIAAYAAAARRPLPLRQHGHALGAGHPARLAGPGHRSMSAESNDACNC